VSVAEDQGPTKVAAGTLADRPPLRSLVEDLHARRATA